MKKTAFCFALSLSLVFPALSVNDPSKPALLSIASKRAPENGPGNKHQSAKFPEEGNAGNGEASSADLDRTEAVQLSVRSLRETECRRLFQLKSTAPDELLLGKQVKIVFADLSQTSGAPGERGRIIGLSGGTSGTVEVEQPDGKTFYTERLSAERSGLKIVRLVQGPGGSMRIHLTLKPLTLMAYAINHELGHIADKMYGPDASLIVDDAASSAELSKKLHQVNENTMVPCKRALNQIGSK